MSQEQISAKQAWLFSIIYSITVVVICCLFSKNFFATDDAAFEMLGFFRQIGSIWFQGELPLIVDSMYLGGNEVIDLTRGIFLPQNILISIITTQNNFIQLAGNILAFINLLLVSLSSLSIAKSLKLGKSYSYAFASIVVIQPVFLYFYLGEWWNAGNGQAWAMVSIATFLLLVKDYSRKNILLNFISVIFLLSSGWPHGFIGYVFFVVVTIIYEFNKIKNLKYFFCVCTPTILAFIFSTLIYSEIIYSNDLINRIHGYYTKHRNYTPSWSMLFLGFIPTWYESLNLSGLKFIRLSMGFSTCFLPVIFFYRNIKVLWQKDANLKWFISLIIVFFMLTQMPSQFGPLRWPFRFIPFLSLFICMFVFYVLKNAPTINPRGIVVNKKVSIVIYTTVVSILIFMIDYIGLDLLWPIAASLLVFYLIDKNIFNLTKSIYVKFNWNFYILLFCCGCLNLFNLIDVHHPFFYILQFFSFWLILLSPYIIEQKRTILFISVNVFTLLIMLMGLPLLAGYYGYDTNLSHRIPRPQNVNLQGFVLSLPKNVKVKEVKQLSEASASQFGLFDIKSINGYTPVGNKRMEEVLPVKQIAHGFFNVPLTLKNVLKKPDNLDDCQGIILRISTIIVKSSDYEKFKEQFKQCGYTQVNVADKRKNLYVSLPLTKTKGWENNIPYAFPAVDGLEVVEHKNNSDLINIPAHNEKITLIFPRLWWKGYSAEINGLPLSVTPDGSGMLVSVEVPPSAHGVLRLSYFPVTWRYLWFLPLLALAGLMVLLFCCKGNKNK